MSEREMGSLREQVLASSTLLRSYMLAVVLVVRGDQDHVWANI